MYKKHRHLLLLLGSIVLLANSWSLTRIPGLLGDEASEGYNAFELLTGGNLTVTGERSYIGPLIDYVRVPFMALFDYSTLAVRLPMLLITALAFWLSTRVASDFFGERSTPYILAMLFLSPVYLLNQRLGWAITTLPFFALLTIYLLKGTPRAHTPLWAGLAAGLGLSTHLLFLPTLVALVTVWLLGYARRARELVAWWPSLLGFWAGFGSQYAVLQLWTEDQGEPAAVLATLSERLSGLPTILPAVISSSAYSASYTGRNFAASTTQLITVSLIVLVILGLAFSPRRRLVAAWLIGLTLHLVILTSMIEQFSVRYFVVFSLGIWTLAGVGLGHLVTSLTANWSTRVQAALPIMVSAVLLIVTITTTLLPWQATGGSTATFEFGPREISGAGQVDIAPLLACLHDAGPVYSNDIHIINRLKYLGLSHSSWWLVPDNKQARYVAVYRAAGKLPGPAERCPELRHFRVVERRS